MFFIDKNNIFVKRFKFNKYKYNAYEKNYPLFCSFSGIVVLLDIDRGTGSNETA